MCGIKTDVLTAVAVEREYPVTNRVRRLLAVVTGNTRYDEQQDVHVRLASFAELATITQPLVLDSYQRA